jgi:hypothetical protein
MHYFRVLDSGAIMPDHDDGVFAITALLEPRLAIGASGERKEER